MKSYDWTGIGYIKENIETGESGWMLSGAIAGGMTSVKKELWIKQDIANELSLPYTPGVNQDPDAVASIVRVNRANADYQRGRVGEQLYWPFEVMARDRTGRPVKDVLVTFKTISGSGTLLGVSPDGSGNPVTGTEITVKTGPDGIAWTVLTLGQKTSDSPYWVQDTPYWTLAGLNQVLVSAQNGSGPIYTDKPFEAYGLPGEAKDISIVNGDKLSGAVNTFSGTLHALVVDRYGNPVSNKQVTFSVQPQDFGPNAPTAKGIENAKIFGNIEDCPMPAILTCQKATNILTKTTDSTGVMAYVILGNTDDTLYTIRAKTTIPGQNNQSKDIYVDFRHYAYPRPRTSGKIADPYLSVVSVYTIDDKGRQIDAAAPGRAFPTSLTAGMYFTQERPDPSDPTACRGSRVFTTEPVEDGSMQFTVTQGGGSVKPAQLTQGPNGLYSTTLTLGPEPAKNTVQADGTITRTVRKADSSGHCTDATIEYKASTTFDVWGVKTTVEPDKIIFIDDNGYPVADTPIKYTVEPADYQYGHQNTYLSIYEDNNWLGLIQADMNGNIVLSRGTAKLGIEKPYTAELVINSGGNVQIKSKIMPLPIASVLVKDDNNALVDEIKFGDGSKNNKTYHIELKSRVLLSSCERLTAKIASVNSQGRPTATPQNTGEIYAAEYPIKFITSAGECVSRITDTLDGNTEKWKFVVSNRSRADLEQGMFNFNVTNKAVLYGGIGNRFKIEVDEVTKYLPIEPVGVIVLGIDGLRQDVLYPQELDAVQDGGQYRVDISNLPGLRQILSGYDQPEVKQKYIMLPNVTAIFPSITLASWASIFTGKLPGETGILGNEFFARDLSISVPPKFDNPAGIISLSSGAFEGYDEFGLFSGLFTSQFFIPYQLNWKNPVDPMTTPQNSREILLPDTVYESIAGRADIPDTGMPGVKSYFNQRGGDPVVVANSHYARGAYWLTWDIEISSGESQILDQASWDKLDDYLGGRYLKLDENQHLVRNKVPFSVLTVWYLPGLDHEAHKKGMGIYKDYFTNTTDAKIKKVVDRLKGLDEFDNKIFIITADHGHTAMPTELKYKRTQTYEDEFGMPYEVVDYPPAEMSCKLNLDLADPDNPSLITNAMKAELANNNLHIWELGEALRSLQEKKPNLQYKVLAPEKIAELFIDTPAGARKNLDPQFNQADHANVVAAFNGPMAHIYLRGQNGWQDTPNPEELKKFAEVLRALYQIDNLTEAQNALGIDMVGYLNLLENTIGRMKQSVDKILIRINGQYMQFDGYAANGYVISPLSFTSDYIKAPERVAGLNHPKRSGDIILIMKDGTAGLDLSRYTTGVACKSWHGSLNASDSYVPFIVAYPGGNRHEITPLIDSTQGCNATSGCDGNWRVTDLIKTIIQKQYGSE